MLDHFHEAQISSTQFQNSIQLVSRLKTPWITDFHFCSSKLKWCQIHEHFKFQGEERFLGFQFALLCSRARRKFICPSLLRRYLKFRSPQHIQFQWFLFSLLKVGYLHLLLYLPFLTHLLLLLYIVWTYATFHSNFPCFHYRNQSCHHIYTSQVITHLKSSKVWFHLLMSL